MTRDDIIRMAREAGFDAHDMSDDFTCNLKNIERFSALIAAAEREACAKRVEVFDKAFQTGGVIAHALIKDVRATVHGSPFEHIGEKGQQ